MTRKGFTLFEILIVIVLISTVTILAVPLANSLFEDSRLTSLLADLNSQIFTQQQKAYSRKNASSYGIAFYTNKYTMYTGNSIGSASATEVINLDSDLQIAQINLTGGVFDLNFTAGSFRPNVSGNVQLKLFKNTYYISINTEGLIYSYRQ